MTEKEERYIVHRKHYLPRAIRAAYRKIDALEQEALECGRKDLVRCPSQNRVNKQWDREAGCG